MLLLLPFDLERARFGPAVTPALAPDDFSFYNALSLDPSTGTAFMTAALGTEFCLFRSGPLTAVNLDTGATASGAIDSCTTGLVASGANVLVFTTGRGSVLGLRPTPCIKVSTNTPLYRRMADDMDLDAGTILDGEPVEAVGRRIFERALEVAGGRPTKSERPGVGEEEFAPWHVGPTL